VQEDEDVILTALFDLADAYSEFLGASFDATLDCTFLVWCRLVSCYYSMMI
jgi:hypothetical protein